MFIELTGFTLFCPAVTYFPSPRVTICATLTVLVMCASGFKVDDVAPKMDGSYTIKAPQQSAT